MHPSIDSNFESADEGTHLLTSPASPSSILPANRTATQITANAAASKHEHARSILLSTTLTRLGSRSWEFATPLLLLEWSPGSLAAPAALGLTCAFSRTIISPWLGGRADTWNSRMDVVMAGTAMQALGCLVSVGALIAWNALSEIKHDGMKMPLLAVVIFAGVIETLGAQLASVAVKKEWVPIVFDEDKHDCDNTHDGHDTDDADNNQANLADGKKSRFPFSLLDSPPITLSFINTAMTNLDLLCAMFGPVLAGWILQVMGGGGEGGDHYQPLSMQRGFATIALLNVISFVPEMVLLRRVYRSCPALQQRRTHEFGTNDSEGNNEGAAEEPDETCGNANNNNIKQSNDGDNEQNINPWTIWFHHPSGLPLLSISLAALYLTALSPNGVVLTAYLVTIGLSPTSLGMFRAIGAFSGVVGIGLFSLFRKWGEDEGDNGNDGRSSANQKSIIHLRRISLAFLLLEVVSVLVAAAAHFLSNNNSMVVGNNEGSGSINNEQPLLSWQIILFLSAIIVSRAGLYSFDVGALELEQYIVDERHRNAVGSVEGALCSLAEMGMYALSIVLPDPKNFGWQVGVSAASVTTGGICFGCFLCLYHMHRHHHNHYGHDDEEDADADGHHHSHRHHHHNHPHTWQQERDLKKFGYHAHLHRSSPSRRYFMFNNHRRE